MYQNVRNNCEIYGECVFRFMIGLVGFEVGYCMIQKSVCRCDGGLIMSGDRFVIHHQGGCGLVFLGLCKWFDGFDDVIGIS